MADNFYSKYSANEPATVVTTLNGLSGALTLVAGTNITITPGSGTLTIDASGGSGANTALSNLALVAVNDDIIPGLHNNVSLGTNALQFAELQVVAIRDSADASGGAGEVLTANGDDTFSWATAGGNIGGGVRARADGNIDLTTLPATVDGISLNNGDLFVAADQGTASETGVYTYTGVGNTATRATGWTTAAHFSAGRTISVSEGDIFHNSILAVQAAITTIDVDSIFIETVGFSYSSVPVELMPYIDNQVQIGQDGKRFQRAWFNTFINIGTPSGPENIELAYSAVSPPSSTSSAGLTAPKSKPLILMTRNNDEVDAVATQDIRRETGNKLDGTGDSGSMIDLAGTTVGGLRGRHISDSLGLQLLTIDAEPTADASTQGTIRIVQAGAGVADIMKVCLKSAADTYSWVTIATG